MKVVIQRVSKAKVDIAGETVASVGKGLLIFIGIIEEDSIEDIKWLAHKIANLRIFPDDNGVMNRSLIDVNAEALVISQFTLHASTKKGHRPSYIKAAKPEIAIPLYEAFVGQLNEQIKTEVQTGEFGADMKVDLINDGPVTIIIDTKNKT